MHRAIKKAGRAILWVILTLFAVLVMVSFLSMGGCITQEMHVGEAPVCVNSKAKIILGKITCVPLDK